MRKITSAPQRGFAHVLVVLLMLAGIGAGAYLVQNPTNFLPKAAGPKVTGVPKQEYTLVPSTTSTINLLDSTANPRPSYVAKVVLEDKTGTAVASQSAMVYTWTASDTKVVNVSPSVYCAPGVDEPCPQSQAVFSGGVVGSATVNVVVTKNKKTLAQATFNVVVSPPPTPTPTPTPLPGITVDKTNVEVTLDKANAQYSLIYGPGFTITSISASGYAIKYNEPTSGQGFYESSGGMVPGGSASIRSYINSNKTVGTYTGSAVVRYSKNNVWYDGPTVTYKITLVDNTKKVFVTSTTYNGNLGGVSGADAKCQERAVAAGLSGTYKAWVSDGSYENDPSNRLNHSTVPYSLLTSKIVASNWSDLTDGSLQNTISVTELGVVVNSSVWTNTATNGTGRGTLNCSNWSNSSTGQGLTGKSYSTTSTWTDDFQAYWACSTLQRLYCFEQ